MGFKRQPVEEPVAEIPDLPQGAKPSQISQPPPSATPTTPGTYTLDQIRQYSLNPASIPSPGSYGEGSVYNIVAMLQTLKDSIKSGALTVADYFNVAEPLVLAAKAKKDALSPSGAAQSKAVDPGWQQIESLGAAAIKNGKWTAILPFSAREYAALPESALPTQKEVNSGLIPLDLLPPIQRFRPETVTPPTPTGTAPGTPQFNPGVTQPGQQPGVPGSPQPTIGVPDPANPGQTINVPIVGDPLQNSVPKTIDQSIIEQEAARQAEQSRQAFEAERAIRSQRLTDLAGVLSKEEDRKFNLAQPGVFEDLNSRGLLRSSGLGEALARERANLAGESANVLSQQGLTDREAEIGGIKDILARSQQFQSSGLERKFTLEDFQKEADLSKSLGGGYTPQVKGGNSVLSGVLGGGLSGAASGAAIGSVVPGLGTAWGAGLGGIMGAVSGGSTKKG